MAIEKFDITSKLDLNLQNLLFRFEFPEFDRDETESWIHEAEQFFAFHHIIDDQRVQLASSQLKGFAVLWFRSIYHRSEGLSWDIFKKSLVQRFGSPNTKSLSETTSKNNPTPLAITKSLLAVPTSPVEESIDDETSEKSSSILLALSPTQEVYEEVHEASSEVVQEASPEVISDVSLYHSPKPVSEEVSRTFDISLSSIVHALSFSTRVMGDKVRILNKVDRLFNLDASSCRYDTAEFNYGPVLQDPDPDPAMTVSLKPITTTSEFLIAVRRLASAVLYHYTCTNGVFTALAAHLYFSETCHPIVVETQNPGNKNFPIRVYFDQGRTEFPTYVMATNCYPPNLKIVEFRLPSSSDNMGKGTAAHLVLGAYIAKYDRAIALLNAPSDGDLCSFNQKTMKSGSWPQSVIRSVQREFGFIVNSSRDDLSEKALFEIKVEMGIQKMSVITLLGYNHELCFRPDKHNQSNDALLRLTTPDSEDMSDDITKQFPVYDIETGTGQSMDSEIPSGNDSEHNPGCTKVTANRQLLSQTLKHFPWLIFVINPRQSFFLVPRQHNDRHLKYIPGLLHILHPRQVTDRQLKNIPGLFITTSESGHVSKFGQVYTDGHICESREVSENKHVFEKGQVSESEQAMYFSFIANSAMSLGIFTTWTGLIFDQGSLVKLIPCQRSCAKTFYIGNTFHSSDTNSSDSEHSKEQRLWVSDLFNYDYDICFGNLTNTTNFRMVVVSRFLCGGKFFLQRIEYLLLGCINETELVVASDLDKKFDRDAPSCSGRHHQSPNAWSCILTRSNVNSNTFVVICSTDIDPYYIQGIIMVLGCSIFYILWIEDLMLASVSQQIVELNLNEAPIVGAFSQTKGDAVLAQFSRIVKGPLVHSVSFPSGLAQLYCLAYLDVPDKEFIRYVACYLSGSDRGTTKCLGKHSQFIAIIVYLFGSFPGGKSCKNNGGHEFNATGQSLFFNMANHNFTYGDTQRITKFVLLLGLNFVLFVTSSGPRPVDYGDSVNKPIEEVILGHNNIEAVFRGAQISFSFRVQSPSSLAQHKWIPYLFGSKYICFHRMQHNQSANTFSFCPTQPTTLRNIQRATTRQTSTFDNWACFTIKHVSYNRNNYGHQKFVRRKECRSDIPGPSPLTTAHSTDLNSCRHLFSEQPLVESMSTVQTQFKYSYFVPVNVELLTGKVVFEPIKRTANFGSFRLACFIGGLTTSGGMLTRRGQRDLRIKIYHKLSTTRLLTSHGVIGQDRTTDFCYYSIAGQFSFNSGTDHIKHPWVNTLPMFSEDEATQDSTAEIGPRTPYFEEYRNRAKRSQMEIMEHSNPWVLSFGLFYTEISTSNIDCSGTTMNPGNKTMHREQQQVSGRQRLVRITILDSGQKWSVIGGEITSSGRLIMQQYVLRNITELLEGLSKFSLNSCQPYRQSTAATQSFSKLSPKFLEEKIITENGHPTRFLLVQWLGFPVEEATWEIAEDFTVRFPFFKACGQALLQGRQDDRIPIPTTDPNTRPQRTRQPNHALRDYLL